MTLYNEKGEPLILLSEASAQLGIAHVTLATQAARGRIEAKKIDGRWYVTAKAIEDYRKNRLNQHGPEEYRGKGKKE